MIAIQKPLQIAAFEPKDVERLEVAYEQTLRALSLTDRSLPITRLIAEKIIAVGRMGIVKDAPLVLRVLTAMLSLSTAAFAQMEKTDAQAAKTDFGKKEYQLQCAVCHGRDGKGGGVFNQVLKIVPPDLTVLAKKNGGVFPAERISSVIDGRVEVASHGSRDMPIWGTRYSVDAAKQFADFPYAEEAYIRARVLRLTDYLYRIQQK